MTELELLVYVSLGVITWGMIALGVSLMEVQMNGKMSEWEGTDKFVFSMILLMTIKFGIFHQILKTICFRIPWYEWFFG